MDALAAGGVMFHNTWAAPECSPARAAMLTGRYNHRLNVTSAILAPDLAGKSRHPSGEEHYWGQPKPCSWDQPEWLIGLSLF